MDCFYEGENMLVIHPDECIDCSVCVPECPVDAIKPDTEPGFEKWLSLNAEYVKVWPKITVKKRPRSTLRNGKGSRTNSNTSHQIPARVIDPTVLGLVGNTPSTVNNILFAPNDERSKLGRRCHSHPQIELCYLSLKSGEHTGAVCGWL